MSYWVYYHELLDSIQDHIFLNVFCATSSVASSCVDRKASDLGLGGMHREYLQTDCAINQVFFSAFHDLLVKLSALFISKLFLRISFKKKNWEEKSWLSVLVEHLEFLLR